MKTLSILRQSGGADTKLKVKNKTKFIILLVIFLILALLLGYGIYYLVDVTFNGSFLNWFANNYFYTETQYNYQTNEFSYLYRPDWPKLKGLIIALFLVFLVFLIVLTLFESGLFMEVFILNCH